MSPEDVASPEKPMSWRLMRLEGYMKEAESDCALVITGKRKTMKMASRVNKGFRVERTFMVVILVEHRRLEAFDINRVGSAGPKNRQNRE